MATKIQVRRDTAANWTSVNPTLSDGELGYETNTGYMKIGNGSTQWSSLSYFTPGAVDGDANTTYTLGTTASGGNANITLTGSDSTNDSVTLVAGTNVTLSVAGDNITAAVDTDLANYNNANTGFITASSSSALTNKTGNISQWTNDSNYLTSGTISLSGKSINELSVCCEIISLPVALVMYELVPSWYAFMSAPAPIDSLTSSLGIDTRLALPSSIK